MRTTTSLALLLLALVAALAHARPAGDSTADDAGLAPIPAAIEQLGIKTTTVKPFHPAIEDAYSKPLVGKLMVRNLCRRRRRRRRRRCRCISTS